METVLNSAQIKSLTKGIKQSGIVEVRLVNPKRTGTITVRGYNEIDQYGSHTWRELVDSKGNIRVVKIQSKKNLNLQNENDRILYAHLIKNKHFVTGPTPLLKLVNLEVEADNFISHREIKSDAEAIIKKASEKELKDLARVMMIGVRPESSANVLKRELYAFIDLQDNKQRISNAENLVATVSADDYELKVVLRDAMALGIIKESLNRLMYNGINLGTSFDSLVEWGKANKDLVSEIQKQLG